MKKVDWLILILVVAIVIAAILWTPESSTKPEEKSQSKLELIKVRLREVQDKVDAEVKTLQLTKEMEAFLEKRVSGLFAGIKLLVVVSFAFVWHLFLNHGYDWLNSLLMASSVLWFAITSTCFLFVSKTFDINTLLDFVRARIRKSIHKKYGYNPIRVFALQQSIIANTNEVDSLQTALEGEFSKSGI